MTGAAATRKTAITEEMLGILEQQRSSAANYLSYTRKQSSGAEAIDVERRALAPAPTSLSSSSNKKKAKNTIQSMLVTTKPGREGTTRMDVCIADFLLSNGLPPLLSTCPMLKILLDAAKQMPASYKAPSRNVISKGLLDATY